MNRAFCMMMVLFVFGCIDLQSGKTDITPSRIVVGGLYATKWDDGKFRIIKVLALDSETAHLRLYAEKFDRVSETIDSEQLTLGDVFGDGPVGLGHFPVAKSSFFNEERQFLKKEEVKESELDGFRTYMEATQ
ncbi:MAG: hypothetical protein AAF483_28520 [Planctomycetota bacterium]